MPLSKVGRPLDAADEGQQSFGDRLLCSRPGLGQGIRDLRQLIILGDEQAQAPHLERGEPVHQVVHVLVVVCSGHP